MMIHFSLNTVPVVLRFRPPSSPNSNGHSHSDPWINRIAIVIQPILEMSQTLLFATRALFNVFTWQDPVLCFWLCFLGPPLGFILYVVPYRIVSFVLGMYWIGPQNYLLRVYRESRPGYQPPDFDLRIAKKKEIAKVEDDFGELQFFSSDAPGNQQVCFRNIDPTQVKQIVVPSNIMMYSNRFYDWPPEPEYARVYASRAPKNASRAFKNSGFINDPDGYGQESKTAYIVDQTARLNPTVKKKKKSGFRMVTSKINKGTRATLGVVERTGGAVKAGTEKVVGSTAGMTLGAVKGTAKQAKSAAKGTRNLLGLRRRNKKSLGYTKVDEETREGGIIPC